MWFDDLKSVLTQQLETIRRVITVGKLGKNHIARDFVPKASSEVINRKTNGYSRKYSVIFLKLRLKMMIILSDTTSKPLYTAKRPAQKNKNTL